MIKKLIIPVCLAVCVLLAVYNAAAAQAAREGFAVWRDHVLPALLPFFVCASLMGARLSGGGSWAAMAGMSFISGAPGGARLCSSLPLDENAFSLCSAALNVVSPMFIYSSFCCSMMGMSMLAAPILIAVFLSAIPAFLFIALPALSKPFTAGPKASAPLSGVGAVGDAMLSLLNICAAIMVFRVGISILEQTGALALITMPLASALEALSLPSGLARALVIGAIEMVNGCTALSGLFLPPRIAAASGAFMFSFGGLCIMIQSSAFGKLRFSRYLLLKLVMGLFSALCAYLITPLFIPDSISVFAPIPTQTLIDGAAGAALMFASSLLGLGTVLLLSAALAKRASKAD